MRTNIRLESKFQMKIIAGLTFRVSRFIREAIKKQKEREKSELPQERPQVQGHSLPYPSTSPIELPEEIRTRLNKDRQEQTASALVREIEDTTMLVTSTLWGNVFYNGKLYKKPGDAQKVRAALVECKQRICAMLDNLIKTVEPRDDSQKEV